MMTFGSSRWSSVASGTRRSLVLGCALALAGAAAHAQAPPQQTACIDRYAKTAASNLGARLLVWACKDLHPDPTPPAHTPELQSEMERFLRDIGVDDPASTPSKVRELPLARCLLREVPSTRNDVGARLAYADCRLANPTPNP